MMKSNNDLEAKYKREYASKHRCCQFCVFCKIGMNKIDYSTLVPPTLTYHCSIKDKDWTEYSYLFSHRLKGRFCKYFKTN